MDKNMHNGISVVIITYNGADRIIPTLEHLSNQESTNFEWEVLIVDNNSKDNTKQIALDFWSSLKTAIPLRVVYEMEQGQMYARKKGFVESKYEYILYCDDDNWLDASYLNIAHKTITSNNQISAVGGLGIIKYEKDFIPPIWMTESYERSYGTGSQGAFDGDITNTKGCLYTAGTIFSKKWLIKLYNIGFESALKGRDGKSLVGGEDTELTLALKLIGGKLYYNSKMCFKHFMPASRINWKYLKKLRYSFGYSNFIVSPYRDFFNKSDKKYIHILRDCLKRLVHLNYLKLKSNPKKGDELLLDCVMELGKLKGILFGYNKYLKNKKMVLKLKRCCLDIKHNL